MSNKKGTYQTKNRAYQLDDMRELEINNYSFNDLKKMTKKQLLKKCVNYKRVTKKLNNTNIELKLYINALIRKNDMLDKRVNYFKRKRYKPITFKNIDCEMVDDD